jgi:hypothetical protein
VAVAVAQRQLQLEHAVGPLGDLGQASRSRALASVSRTWVRGRPRRWASLYPNTLVMDSLTYSALASRSTRITTSELCWTRARMMKERHQAANPSRVPCSRWAMVLTTTAPTAAM